MDNVLNIHPYNIHAYIYMHNLVANDVFNYINDNVNVYNVTHNLNNPMEYYINDIHNQYNQHNQPDAPINIPLPHQLIINNAVLVYDINEVNNIINTIINNDPVILQQFQVNVNNNVNNIATQQMVLINHMINLNNQIATLQQQLDNQINHQPPNIPQL